MKFCDNPKCQNHLEHNLDILCIDKSNYNHDVKEIKRHQYYSAKKQLFFICDTCHNAIRFIKNKENNNV